MRVFTVSLSIYLFLGVVAAPAFLAQSPLAYSISLEHRDLKRKTLTIKITIKNVSSGDAVIDKTGPFYRVDVKKHGRRMKNRFTTEGEFLEIIGDGNDPEYLRLPPRGTFIDRRVLPLDLNFFEKGRRYAVTLTYGHFRTTQFQNIDVWKGTVASNTLDFGF